MEILPPKEKYPSIYAYELIVEEIYKNSKKMII